MSIFGKGDQLRSNNSGSGRGRGPDFLDRLFQHFKDRKDSKKWRAGIMSLAVVVVFLTTYGLILPAITMEKEKAQDLPGVHLASDSSHDEEMRTRGDPEPEDESVREEDVENKGSIESMDDSSSGQEKNGDDDPQTEKEGESQEKNEEPDRTTDQKEGAGKVEYMTGTLTCRTVGHEISMALEAEDRIPEGTQLNVILVPKGNPDYKVYEEAIQKKDARLTGQIYYQFKLTYKGKEIRPAKPVDITFTSLLNNTGKVDYGVLFRKGKTGLKARLISPEYEDRYEGSEQSDKEISDKETSNKETSDKETSEKSNLNTGRDKASLSQKINTEHVNSDKLSSDTGNKDKRLSRQGNSKTISRKKDSETGKFNSKDKNSKDRNSKENNLKDSDLKGKYSKTNSTELVASKTDILKISDIGGPGLLAAADNEAYSPDDIFMLSNVPLNLKRTLTVIGLASIEESQDQESGTKGEVGEKTGDQDKNDDGKDGEDSKDAKEAEEGKSKEEDGAGEDAAAEGSTGIDEDQAAEKNTMEEEDTSAEEVLTGQEDSTEEAEEIEPEVHPAQTFQAQTKHLNIYVEAPEGALPEGTVMRVREVTNQETIDAITKTVEEAEESNGQGIGADEKDSRDQEALTDENTSQGEAPEDKEDGSAGSGKKENSKKSEKADKKARKKEVLKVQAVDITFTDKEGNEIEPLQPIHVTITSKMVDEAAKHDDQEITAVHLDGDGKGSIMETETKKDKISFDADAFSVYALVNYAQISQTVISASGETYLITVTYGEDAGIPDGAELKVREILPGDEEYEEYYSKSEKSAIIDAANQGIEDALINGQHIFDISIYKGNDKIQPSAPVQVNIQLVSEESKVISVVHFAQDGPEVMELQKTKENEHTNTSLDLDEDNSSDENKVVNEVQFETRSFSVYDVVSITDASQLISGGPYVLVSQTGPTIKSGESGTPVSVNRFALTSSTVEFTNNQNTKTTTLAGKGVFLSDSNQTIGGYLSEWNFESAGNGKYRVYTGEGNNKKYLTTSYNSINTTSDQSQATSFTVELQNNKIRLSINVGGGTWYVTNDNHDGRSSYNSNVELKLSQYKLDNNTNADVWFTLGKNDPKYEEQTAKKVEASDWKAAEGVDGRWNENDKIIIYRRQIKEDGSDVLFALATDGSWIEAYDGGDSIYYHCPEDKSVEWHIVQNEKGYFISDIGDNIYLAPSKTNNTWSSEEPVGLTMTGMGSGGSYGSKIENWDQVVYAYAGLHLPLDSNNRPTGIVQPGIGNEDDTFLFAVSDTLISDGELHTVETVDSTSMGITIKMFNYGGDTGHYGYRNQAMQEVLGDWITSEWSEGGLRKFHVTQTVEPVLDNGFPKGLQNINNGNSLSPLFSDGDIYYNNGSKHITVTSQEANHLFLQSYYDENGMFRYSSMDNFAHLTNNTETIDGRTVQNFDVFRETGTPYVWPKDETHYYYYHGHFMPYNELDPTTSLSRIVDQYGNIEDIDNGRVYENVYGLKGEPDYYVGMSMEADFVQPRGGTLENGDPVVYRFTGDDDLWVYIDGVLVLDIGGIHEPLTGSINFETGKVIQPPYFQSNNNVTQNREDTIYGIFEKAHDAGKISDDDWAKMKWKDVDNNGTPDTFADYTTHSFNMFYMERGAGASNLDLAFNLQVVKRNEFSVKKELPEDIDTRFVNQSFKFQATFKDGNTEKPLYKGAQNSASEVVCTKIVYKDRKDANGRPIEEEVDVDNDGYFYLKSGETAVFMMADETTEYNIKEVDISSYNLEQVTIDGGGTSEHVEINDEQADVENNMAAAGLSEVQARNYLFYTNYPKKQNLLITKHLTEDSAPVETGENPVFEFRVYLETTVEKDGNEVHQLIPYSYGPYYLVKEVEVDDGSGNKVKELHYFTLDKGDNNEPNDHGTTKTVCSKTGRSGSINSIPPEYTIVIPDLIIGTNFYLEERRDNIPVGYEFVEEILKPGTYDESSLIHSGDPLDTIHRIIARDESDHQEYDPETVGRIKAGKDAESHVYNRKPYVDVTVEKKWMINGQEPANWPADMTVEYKLVRQMILTNKGTEYLVNEEDVDKPVEIRGILSSDNQKETFAGLLTSGSFTVPANTADQSDITKTAISDNIIEAGKTYRVLYRYKAIEVDAKYKGKSLNLEGVEALAVKTADAVQAAEATDTTPAVEAKPQQNTATLENRLISVKVEKDWEGTPNADSVEMKLYRTIRTSKITINVELADPDSKATGITAHINGQDVPLTKGEANLYTGQVTVPYGKTYPITFTGEAEQGYIVSVEGRSVDVNNTEQTVNFEGIVTSKTTDVTIRVEMNDPDNAVSVITAHVGNLEDVPLTRESGNTYSGSVKIPQGSGTLEVTFDAVTDTYHTVAITPVSIEKGYEDSKEVSTSGSVVGKTSEVTFNVILTDPDSKATAVEVNVNGNTYPLTKGANNTWSRTQTLPQRDAAYPVQVLVTAGDNYTVELVDNGAGEVTVNSGDPATWSTTGTVTKPATRTITWVVAGATPSWANLCYPGWNSYSIQPKASTWGNSKIYIAEGLPTNIDFMIQQGDLNYSSISNSNDYSSYNIRANNNETLLDIPAGTDDITIVLKVGNANAVLFPYTVNGTFNVNQTGTIKYVNYNDSVPISTENGADWNVFNNSNTSTHIAYYLPLSTSNLLCFTNIGNPSTGYYMIHKNGYSGSVSGTGVVESSNFIYVPVGCTDLTFGTATNLNSQNTSSMTRRLLSAKLSGMNLFSNGILRTTPLDQTVVLTTTEAPEPTVTGNDTYPVFTNDNLVDTQNVSADAWSYTWSYLPEKDADGNTYDYYVVETIPTGTGSVAYTRQVNAGGDTNVNIKNTPYVPEEASLTVNKNVVGATTDRLFTIRLQRTKDGSTKWLQYNGTNQCTWLDNSSEASTWTFRHGDSVTFTGLETGYTYTVVEDTASGLVEVNKYNFDQENSTTSASAEVTQLIAYSGTITNKYTPSVIDIKLKKVDENSNGLAGAVFILQKNEGSFQNIKSIKDTDGVSQKYSDVGGIDEDSKFTSTSEPVTITNLPDGSYKLIEDSTLPGYVITVREIEFTITDQKISGTDIPGKVVFDRDTAVITVSNEPGAALPMTGGPGNNPIYLFGIMLTAFAGGGFLMKRRRRGAA